MDFTKVCRTCLKCEYLNPVFPNSEDWYRYSNAVQITTGIKIEFNDGLPQKVCSLCIHFINQSLKFRKTCKDVQAKLLESLETEIVNSYDEITESGNDFIVFSGEKVNNEIKIEIEQEKLHLNESNNVKLDCTDCEALLDEEKDEKSLNYLEVDENYLDYLEEDEKTLKETETAENNIKVGIEVNSNDKLSETGLYLLNDCSDNGKKRVICKLCQKNLSIRSIDAHMDKTHPGADERKIKCELCESYLIRNKMNRHMSIVHGIKKGQEKNSGRCGYCKTEFDSKEVLIQHVADCTAKKKKRKVCASSRQLTECDICNKKMQKASLRMHKATAHAGMKPVCEHCGRAFGNKFRLNEHYRAKHGYDKFKCSFCDFESAGIVSMQNHLRRHRGEKPFVCETCGAKFHAAYLLAQHKQSHRTERPLKCDLCTASFKATNSLHMHKKACHGPALYKCAACPRSYSCKHYAVKHMRRAHRFSGPLPPLRELTDTQDVDDNES